MDKDTKKAFRLARASIEKLIDEAPTVQQKRHLKIALANIMRVEKMCKGEWKI